VKRQRDSDREREMKRVSLPISSALLSFYYYVFSGKSRWEEKRRRG